MKMGKKELTSLVGLSQDMLDKSVKESEGRWREKYNDELQLDDLTGEMRECGDTTWLQSWLDEVEADAKKDGDTLNDRHRHKFTHAPNGVRGRRRVCAPSARARVSPAAPRLSDAPQALKTCLDPSYWSEGETEEASDVTRLFKILYEGVYEKGWLTPLTRSEVRHVVSISLLDQSVGHHGVSHYHSLVSKGAESFSVDIICERMHDLAAGRDWLCRMLSSTFSKHPETPRGVPVWASEGS